MAIFGQAETYTIETNNPDKIKWLAGLGSNPNSYLGVPFELIFQRNSSTPKDSYGSYVEAFCEADPGITKKIDIKVAPECSEFEPLTLTTVLANASLPPSGMWGFFEGNMERNLPTIKECVSRDKMLENRVPEIIHEYDLRIYPLTHPKAIIGSNDSKITNNNCMMVLRDLTPTQSGSPYPWPTAPMSTYWAAKIVTAHEHFHNTDFISVVSEPLKNALEVEVKQLEAAKCEHNSSYLNQIIDFYEQKNRNLQLQWLGGSVNGVAHEQRAYVIENAQLIKLTNAIRVRAQNEGWRRSCQ